MSAHQDTAIQAGGAMPPAMVRVWDPFVRVFHWSLATLFIVAYATGDEAQLVHIAVGYSMVGLIALRVIWGFIGPHHARISSFVRSPCESAQLSPRRRYIQSDTHQKEKREPWTILLD